MKTKIAGTGQHSHEVPLRDGRVVEMRDASHEGTAVYWSENRARYVFVSYDQRSVDSAPRVVLLRGGDVALEGVYACDLDTPDGLFLVGVDLDDDLSWARALQGECPVEVLWDSKASGSD